MALAKMAEFLAKAYWRLILKSLQLKLEAIHKLKKFKN
jgi:hypothetical protein